MNRLQQFITDRPFGFLTSEDMPALIEMDRLFQVLIRCGGCRMTCAAQDVANVIRGVEAGGDYVRDVSFPVGSYDRAAAWVDPGQARKPAATDPIQPTSRTARQDRHAFDEGDCSGVYDGSQVWSETELGGAPGF